jgi:hypothetical protein
MLKVVQFVKKFSTFMGLKIYQLMGLKIYQRVHKTMLPLDLILRQFNSAHTCTVLIFSILSSILKDL